MNGRSISLEAFCGGQKRRMFPESIRSTIRLIEIQTFENRTALHALAGPHALLHPSTLSAVETTIRREKRSAHWGIIYSKFLIAPRRLKTPAESNKVQKRTKGARRNSPLRPVLSGSTKACLTIPSATTSAYRLLRSPPKMAEPSKARSSALVKLVVGSPRKRICVRCGD